MLRPRFVPGPRVASAFCRFRPFSLGGGEFCGLGARLAPVPFPARDRLRRSRPRVRAFLSLGFGPEGECLWWVD